MFAEGWGHKWRDEVVEYEALDRNFSKRRWRLKIYFYGFEMLCRAASSDAEYVDDFVV